MTADEQQARDHIEALEEELAAMPHSPGHAAKRADRERQRDFYVRYLDRLQAIRESYLVRRAELLMRNFPSIM